MKPWSGLFDFELVARDDAKCVEDFFREFNLAVFCDSYKHDRAPLTNINLCPKPELGCMQLGRRHRYGCDLTADLRDQFRVSLVGAG